MEHPLFPQLAQQFKTDAPSLPKTATAIRRDSFSTADLIDALAQHDPSMMTVRAGANWTGAAFYPDFGVQYAKLTPPDTMLRLQYVPLDLFSRTTTGWWIAQDTTELGGMTFARCFDFPDHLFYRLLHATVPDVFARRALRDLPAGELVSLPMVVHLTATVGPDAVVDAETYRPMVVRTATLCAVTQIIVAGI